MHETKTVKMTIETNNKEIIKMKRFQQFLVLSIVTMSVLTIAIPTLAASGNDQPRARSYGPDYFYGEAYGYAFEWSQEVWRIVQSDLERRVDIDKSHRFTQAVLRQQYGTPDAQAIPMENAVAAAIHAIAAEGLITKAVLEADYTVNALYLIGTSQPKWKISFTKMFQGEEYAFDLFHAEVNAYTGEVRNIGRFEPGENYYEPYVLYEVLVLVDKEMPEQPELPSNG